MAGISGFRAGRVSPSNPSAVLLREWLERGTFTWIVSEEILDEYKGVLGRLGVRRETIGLLINLLREEAELITPKSKREVSPDPADDRFCACADEGFADFLVTLNARDFPQQGLSARVLAPGEVLPSGRSPRRK